ncbi:MAG TPA: PLDc N-terminal domain-containing protein [Lamprocystis sp. (in: g-proteobacteria)]|nr:PLDc N-terminal domain-containing protein [Lamprocystis sp. (in: g-proteobacteria)]
MSIQVGGLVGVLHLILTVYAIVKIIQSNAGTGSKVIWIVLVLLLPVLGLVLWLLVGPKG